MDNESIDRFFPWALVKQAEQHTRWKEESEKQYDELSSVADDLKQVLFVVRVLSIICG